MALKIRLQVRGRRHHRKYRIVVAEEAARRDGKHVEILGYYNPQPRGQDIKCEIDLDRAEYWKGVGAKPTETVAGLIRKARRGEEKFVVREAKAEAVAAN